METDRVFIDRRIYLQDRKDGFINVRQGGRVKRFRGTLKAAQILFTTLGFKVHLEEHHGRG